MFRLTVVAAALSFAFGCANPGAANGAANDILPGTWSCSDGGSITLNEDGTGETDCAYFLEQVCFNEGEVPTYTITWEIVEDPDVVNDNFGWDIDQATRDALSTTLGCTVGEGNVEEPILSARDSEVRFGFDFLGEESVFQTLTR